MSAPFTPGPWRSDRAEKPGSNGDFYVFIRDATDRKIAGVWGRRGEKEATAALIAAAPELYAALDTATAILTRLAEHQRQERGGAVENTAEYLAYLNATAALAKARGEPPENWDDGAARERFR